jgi:hypothetical protein
MIGAIKKVIAAKKDNSTEQTVIISGLMEIEIMTVGMIAMATEPINFKAIEQLAPPILIHVPEMTLPVNSTTMMAGAATPGKDDRRIVGIVESVLMNPAKGRLIGVSTTYLLSSINGQVPSFSGKMKFNSFATLARVHHVTTSCFKNI